MQNKKGFTFIELIIVISIILMLSVIGFIGYENYLPDSRDASRLGAMTELKNTFEMNKLKSALPIPDSKVDIQVNGVLNSYQGYLSKDILDGVEYSSSGKDPKDNVFYTYYLAKDSKRFTLMAYLENKPKKITSFYMQSANASSVDYTNRYPITFGDKLGVLTDKDTNIPIQDILFIKNQGYINFTGSLTGSYNLYVSSSELYASNDNIFMGQKINEILKTQDSKLLSSTGCLGTTPDINGVVNAISQPDGYSWIRTSTPGACTWDCKPGYYWNGTICSIHWTGTAITGFTFKNTSGVSQYPTSCNNLLTNSVFKVGTSPWTGTKFVDGMYFIDTDGAGPNPTFKVFCDMTSDSGGWTLLARASGEGTATFSYSDINSWTPKNSDNCSLTNECLSQVGLYLVSWNDMLIYTRGYKVKGTLCNDQTLTIKGYTQLSDPTNSSNGSQRNTAGKGAQGKCDTLTELAGNTVSNNDTGGWYIRMGLKMTGNEVGENSILFYGSTERCMGLGNSRSGCQKKLSNNNTGTPSCNPNDMVFQPNDWDGASTVDQTWFIR